MKGLVAGIGVLVILVLVAVWFFMGMSYRNKEVSLRNAVTAKQKANEASHDTMWKILSQQAQVSEKYKDSFKEIYVEIMEGRHYDKGGNFMKWITEASPVFSDKMFEKLMVSIEGERKRFFRDQEELLALKQEHDNVRTTEPGRWFVGDKPEITVQIITSSRSGKAMETGVDDDVELFKK